MELETLFFTLVLNGAPVIFLKRLFFRTVIDNEQMVLIKADLMIAELYSELEDDLNARSRSLERSSHSTNLPPGVYWK